MKQGNPNRPNYELLAKYFAGECSHAEKRKVETWLNASVENKASFDSLYFLWVNSNRNIVAKNIDENRAWSNFQERISLEKKAKSVKIIFFGKNFLRIAAVFILGIMLTFIYKYQFQTTELQLAIAENEIQELLLQDSSEITLNKLSELEYPEEFEGNKRKVKLKGEAYFKIAHNAEKQFAIETEFVQIKVVGTEFNVQAYDSLETTVISVNEGIVELNFIDDTTKKVSLRKGEVGIVDNKTGTILKQEAENISIDFWRTKILKFRNSRLDVVTATLSEIYKVKFKFKNEKLKNCELNFEFPDMEIDEVLSVIAVTFDLTFTKENEIYMVDGEGC